MARRRLLRRIAPAVITNARKVYDAYKKIPEPIREAAKNYAIDKGIEYANSRAQNMPNYGAYRNFKTAPITSYMPKMKSVLTGKIPTDTSYRTVGTTSTYLKGQAPYISGPSIVKYRFTANASGSITGTVYGQRSLFTAAGFTTSTQFALAATSMFPGTTKNMSVQLAKAYTKLAFHNMDRVTARLFVYDLIAAQDMPATDNNPLEVFNRVAAQYDTVVTGNANIFDLDVDPEDFPNFRKQWRIVKKTIIDMEPGKTHYHNYNVYRRYPLSEVNISDGDAFFKGISTSQLLIAQSAPIRDAADSAVTLGTPDVIFTASHELLFLGNLKGNTIKNNVSDLDSAVTTQNVKSTNSDNLLAGDLTNADVTVDNDP